MELRQANNLIKNALALLSSCGIKPSSKAETQALLCLLGQKDINSAANCKAENNRLFFRTLLCMSENVQTFDIAALLSLHETLYGGFKSDAGKLRTTPSELEGSSFTDSSLISGSVKRLLCKMNELSGSPDSSKEDFALSLTYYFSEMFLLCPFKNGSLLTQSLFFWHFVKSKGFYINFHKNHRRSFYEAVKTAFLTDEVADLYICFSDIVSYFNAFIQSDKQNSADEDVKVVQAVRVKRELKRDTAKTDIKEIKEVKAAKKARSNAQQRGKNSDKATTDSRKIYDKNAESKAAKTTKGESKTAKPDIKQSSARTPAAKSSTKITSDKAAKQKKGSSVKTAQPQKQSQKATRNSARTSARTFHSSPKAQSVDSEKIDSELNLGRHLQNDFQPADDNVNAAIARVQSLSKAGGGKEFAECDSGAAAEICAVTAQTTPSATTIAKKTAAASDDRDEPNAAILSADNDISAAATDDNPNSNACKQTAANNERDKQSAAILSADNDISAAATDDNQVADITRTACENSGLVKTPCENAPQAKTDPLDLPSSVLKKAAKLKQKIENLQTQLSDLLAPYRK